MARKAVQGYTEKSYYDNTKFLGTVATNDPVSEGYFRQLVNFDISDTGQSLTPRKGFITTSLCTPNGARITLSKNTIIYKDNRIQQYIIYDFDSKFGYRADLDADALRPDSLLEATKITNYDRSDIYEYLLQRVNKDVEQDISNDTTFKNFIDSNLSIYSEGALVTDSDAVQKYVMKLKCVYADPESGPDFEYIFLVGIFYRKDAVDSQGLSEDTLVFTVIDFDQQPSVYTFERNLASKESIIPETMQVVYNNGETPERFVNQFPIIYAKTNDNKYLLNMCNDHKMKVIPHFQLEKSSDPNIHWYYTYDIVENSVSTNNNDDAKIYRAPIYTVSDNIRVHTHIGLDAAVESATKNYELLKNIPIITIIPKEPAKLSVDGVTVTELTDDSTVYDNPTEDVMQGRIFALRFVNTYPEAILPTVNAGERIGTLNKRIYDIRNKLTTVQTREELISVLLSIPDDYLYYVKTFDETYDDYDIRYGSLFKRSCLYGDQYLSNVKTGYLEGSYFGNAYGIGALNKDEIISYINKSPVSEFFFRFYPTAFVFRYLYKHSANSPDIFPTTYLSSYTDFYIYCGVCSLGSSFIALKDFLKSKNTYKATVINAEHITEETDESLFQYDNNLLVADFNNIDTGGFKKLYDSGYFTNGIHIVFYLFQAQNMSTSDEEFHVLFSRLQHVTATTFMQNFFIQKTNRPVTYIEEYITKEPEDIQTAKNFITFNNDRLVFWHKNVVYMSEPGDYYYFKYSGMHEFGERVVKVIQFKTILLVFTVQHLYAIFETEVPIQTINAEGTLETASTFEWASLPVLYNILTSDKYADAIQVFNQMVLFYSEDGQMFMIKPSTTIDSDTRFSLQYFNKAVNDILLNYDIYINERLQSYGIEQTITKDDVRIKALLSVNFIKLFFYVPGLITYIIIYDVINNRYQVYDTTTFTNIKDKMFVESGDLLITEQDDALYFTAQHTNIFNQDGNVDLAITNNFKKEPINALIDTGNINLNNHLIKRYRDLFITFKNISSKELLYNVETILDDVVVKPHYNKMLEVRNIHNTSVYTEVAVSNERDLAPLYTDNNNISNGANMLMDFSGFNSNKLITHRSSILGMSKVIRVRLQFKSKGVYKIQNFGFVFKERRI